MRFNGVSLLVPYTCTVGRWDPLIQTKLFCIPCYMYLELKTISLAFAISHSFTIGFF